MRFSPRALSTIVVLVGAALFFYLQLVPQGGLSPLSERGKANSGLPVRLKISAIHVDSAVGHVGRTPDGAMDTPKKPDDVAWYQLGARPGENGTAVIAGHSGWKDGVPAAFDSLYKLHTGDRILIEDDTGTITSFIVREIRSYDPKADAEDVFNSNDGKSHLNLITCEGLWDAAKKTYSERLVVFADKE